MKTENSIAVGIQAISLFHHENFNEDRLISNVQEQGGIKAVHVHRNQSNRVSGWLSVPQSAIKQLVSAFIHPMKAAASSLRPDLRTLSISLLEFLFSFIFLVVVLSSEKWGFSFNSVLRLFSYILIVLSVIGSVGFLIHKLGGVVISSSSWMSFALHLTSAILFIFSFWLTVGNVIVPNELMISLNHVISDTNNSIPIENRFGSVLKRFSFFPIVLLYIPIVAVQLHFLWGLINGIRGMAISVGHIRYALITVVIFFILVAVNFLSFVDLPGFGLRKTNLPYPLEVRWGQDKITSSGIEKDRLYMSLTGLIEKDNNILVIRVDKLIVENRTEPKFLLTKLDCSLGVWKDSEFKWANPSRTGEIDLNTYLSPGDVYTLESRTIRIPVDDKDTPSGKTDVRCFLSFPRGYYPLGIANGLSNILKW